MVEWLKSVVLRIRALFRPTALEQDYEDEIAFHLAMREEHYRASGADHARLLARRRFGGEARIREDLRETWAMAPLVSNVARDIRYALRTLRRNPGFTLAAVATLAIAIGANTAMFAVMHAVVFKPLPYRAPEQLVMVWTERPSEGVHEGRTAYLDVERWRSQSRSFADIAVFDPVSATLTIDGEPEQVGVARISPNLFSLLGIPIALGRSFTDDEAVERRPLVIVSAHFWQTRFSGSPNAVGTSVDLDGRASTIVGVLPKDFQFPGLDADVFEPYTLFPDWNTRRQARGAASWFVVGRLRPGTTLESAQAEMSIVGVPSDAQATFGDRNSRVHLQPLSLFVTGPRSRQSLWMLVGAVLAVLLIAATNVASLSFARNAGRVREIAIRTALGASRLRIAGQLFVESLTLAFVSGALGFLLATGGIRIVRNIVADALPRAYDIDIDPWVFTISLLLCLGTGVFVGLAPALTAARRDLRPSMVEGGRGVASGSATRRIRRVLVRTEFALAIVLLVGAGLLLRSLWSAQHIDTGFDAERVLSMQLSSPAGRTSPERADVYQRMLEEVASVPGVDRAGIIGDFVFAGGADQIVTTEGSAHSSGTRLRLRRDEASPDLFAVVGARLIEGRAFTDKDHASSVRVAILNESLARRLWPGAHPIGQRFKLGAAGVDAPWFTVVGVVGDMRRQGPEVEPIPEMFEPLAQNPSRLETLLVRTSGADPLAVAASVRAAVHRVDARMPTYLVTTLEQRLGSFLAERRLITSLLAAFSIVALLLAGIGIYGLIHYSVATRTQEIAIRLAMGARETSIFRMVIGEGLTLSLTGIGIGMAGAVVLGRAGSSLLFGVTAADPWTLVAVAALLMAVAIAACSVPARRAMKVSPVIALRQD